MNRKSSNLTSVTAILCLFTAVVFMLGCLACSSSAVAFNVLAAKYTVGERFLGIPVEPEHRCSKYDRKDYHYPASIEQEIVARQGGIFGPYERREFGSIRETDIEHIVAAAEAHDSGMCARSKEERRAFARDLDNLTLASPKVNRWQKSDRDAAEWMPEYSRCWYIGRILEVKRKWGLSIDLYERDALETGLWNCTRSWGMENPD